MEPGVPVTRKRRKQPHSTKCPCCSEDRGKPEKEPRRRRPEDCKSQPADTCLKDSKSSTLIEGDKTSTDHNDVEENSVKEGRVLRSGRSTPVTPIEMKKGKRKASRKCSKTVEPAIFGAGKARRKPEQRNNVAEKNKGESMLAPAIAGFKPVFEENLECLHEKCTTGTQSKVKNKKRKTKRRSPQSVGPNTWDGDSMSSLPSESSDQAEGKGENIKVSSKLSKKKPKKKCTELLPAQPVAKKTLAVERLKAQAFDQLKKKLEIAFGQSSLTVPQCVEMLQRITPPSLKDAFNSQSGGTGKSDPENHKPGDESTEEASENGVTQITEKELCGNMNACEAAEALVSFKDRTSGVVSSSNVSHSHGHPMLKKWGVDVPSREINVSIPDLVNNVDSLAATPAQSLALPVFKQTSSYGLPGLPAPTQSAPKGLPQLLTSPPPKPHFTAGTCTSVKNSPAMPSISIVQTPVTFQMLQVPNQGISPVPAADLTNNFQQSTGLVYQNPTTTVMNKLTPASVVTQQRNPVISPNLNQLLYFPKLKQQQNQKLLDPKSQDQLLTQRNVASTSLLTGGASVSSSTISTQCSTLPNVTDILHGTKLRPILPREPVVSPNLSLFNQGLQQNACSGILPKVADPSTNVKQAVKRLVNERTKTNGPSTTDVVTSPPDVANTCQSSSSSSACSKSHGRQRPVAAKKDQDCTDLASKEQAITALLSIGGSEGLSQPKSGKQDGLGNRSYETNESSELKVVFDTDKGIFKVDDVTIDPQVNSISKESYTCGKCGKIFTSLSYLARHIKRVCPDMSHRKWKCVHCDKAFRHPFGLQQHVYTHTGERPHKCPQCPKAFYSSNDLRRHSRIHSGERPYKCKHCGKCFATTISLKTHTFIHTGEKPHRCPHCPKTFATSSKLGRHIVTHSEQRPYSCVQCPKTFNRSGDLRRHSLHVHNGNLADVDSMLSEEKMYRCTECNGSFDTAKELEMHISDHATENGLINNF